MQCSLYIWNLKCLLPDTQDFTSNESNDDGGGGGGRLEDDCGQNTDHESDRFDVEEIGVREELAAFLAHDQEGGGGEEAQGTDEEVEGGKDGHNSGQNLNNYK